MAFDIRMLGPTDENVLTAALTVAVTDLRLRACDTSCSLTEGGCYASGVSWFARYAIWAPAGGSPATEAQVR